MAELWLIDGQRRACTIKTCEEVDTHLGPGATLVHSDGEQVFIGRSGSSGDAASNADGSLLLGFPVVGPLLVLSQSEWLLAKARTLGWEPVDDPLTRALLAIPAGHGAYVMDGDGMGRHLSRDVSAPHFTAALVTMVDGDPRCEDAVVVATLDAGIAWFAARGYPVTRQSTWQPSLVTFTVLPTEAH